MANVIELPNQTQGIIQNFLNEFNQNHRFKQAQQQQQGIANQESADRKSMLDQQQQLESAKLLLAGWQQRINEGDPTVAQEAQQYIADHPEQKALLASAAMYHASAGQQAIGAAQQKHLADNQALGNGATSPENRDVYVHDVTGAFSTPQAFAQSQATDLQNRASTTPSQVPNLTQPIPAPSGNAVSDYEARSTGALTEAQPNLQSQTQLKQTGMQQQGETARTRIQQAGETERKKLDNQPDASAVVDPKEVANVVTAINTAVGKNIDPSAILSRIKPNKALYNAVIDQLTNPQNQAGLTTDIKSAQKTALVEIDPLIEQAKKVAAAYAPYKTQNGLTDRDTKDYMLYRLGQKPSDDSPASQLANLQMLGVQAGARLLKGGSRAYPALKMAMQHAGNGAIDTRAQIYDKTLKLIDQLQRVHDANAGTLQPSPNGAGGNDDPLGIFK